MSSYLERIIAEEGEGGAEKLAIAHEFDPFLLADLLAQGEKVDWTWDQIEDEFIRIFNLQKEVEGFEAGKKRNLITRFAAARKYDAALLEEVIREYRPRKASWEEILDCFSCRVIMRGDAVSICDWSEEIVTPTSGQEN